MSIESAGNLPPLSAVFPDQMQPVIRIHEGEAELLPMSERFPSSQRGNHPVTFAPQERDGFATFVRPNGRHVGFVANLGWLKN